MGTKKAHKAVNTLNVFSIYALKKKKIIFYLKHKSTILILITTYRLIIGHNDPSSYLFLFQFYA